MLTKSPLYVDQVTVAAAVNALHEHLNFKPHQIFGIPNGGMIPAYMLASKWQVPLVINPINIQTTLIVDELLDSGATIRRYQEKYPACTFATLFTKSSALSESLSVFYVGALEEPDVWLVFPWEVN